jgi:tRNA pseudouridine38-40 synthase
MSEPRPAQRWKCVCAYDGTTFTGWQSQPGGRAIQDLIEARLRIIFGREIRIHGSGRTDAGVHALAQVFHFDAEWTHGVDKLLAAFRTGLPPTIQIKSARKVPADFHARFGAKGKVYFYQLHEGQADPFLAPFCVAVAPGLDVAAMRAAAGRLVGRHDFRAYSALNGAPREDAVKHLRRLEVTKRGARIRITAEADGFLYKMVRSLVGALLAVGQGKISPEQVSKILESRTRTMLVKTAPPQGLFLAKVHY